ncbi:MAG: DUF1501 domain-containing protein [Cyclobacteriaceae bacterium]|nr:DUF1501 domain-containing protein [Cyclobacteriaceae bacterium]
MKRRKFIQSASSLATSSFMLGGIPVNVLAGSGALQRVAGSSDTDRVVVLIQLHGGNDGLNTTVPLDQYAIYQHLRPNIALPNGGNRRVITLDHTVPSAQSLGLHPDMADLKNLYDHGKMAVVQGVAYENINGSHFRSRDIWFMGAGYDESFDSGWMGRYLDHEYPGFPDEYPNTSMPDPPAIEIGNVVSLAFHRANGIPMGISIQNPEQFYNLINQVGGLPPESIANSYYGQELKWIIDIEEKSNQYASRLSELYKSGKNSPVTYPELYPFNAPAGVLRNQLAPQLKMVARLLDGGCKTRVFLVRIGGFDTHARQVESFDATMGIHSALLYHLSSAVKAFQDDLRNLGLEDRVLTMTFSEFGRRAISNGSFGSDHGTSAPMFVFGKHVNAGIFGDNPDLSNLRNGNLEQQFDYRQLFTSALTDWLEASDSAIQATYFNDYVTNRVPLIGGRVVGLDNQFTNERFRLNACFPNPVQNLANFSFFINGEQNISLKILDVKGREVMKIAEGRFGGGEHFISKDLSQLSPGSYVYILETPIVNRSKKLVKL